MKKWYILHHPERLFPSLQAGLDRLDVDYFMPTIQEFSVRKDRPSLRTKRPKPLFPCYMFVLLDPEITHTSKILQLNGAATFLRFGEKFYTMLQEHIDAMKLIEFRILHNDEKSFSCINASPKLFKNMQSIYKIKKPEQRLIALQSLLDLSKKMIA